MFISNFNRETIVNIEGPRRPVWAADRYTRTEPLRIDNSDWSVNCTAPINEVWTGCSQRVYYILHIFR